MAAKKPGVIALFDVDDTLTAPRKEATQEMLDFIQKLRKVVTTGLVGGSDLNKISEQLGKTVTNDFDYCFTENGLVAINESRRHNGTMQGSVPVLKHYQSPFDYLHYKQWIEELCLHTDTICFES
ncbi:hypothetical protein F2Q69_00018105 [Brassica cretica]|uniref:Phosphomannomutase n=1 Tax=Brassica cretica TaxID=69181 RepID=A0A8S9QWF8_BRACR|nr:hypothetical protein F2Q69_00018105 [Brassica cretica]